jgi:hypothetical protein
MELIRQKTMTVPRMHSVSAMFIWNGSTNKQTRAVCRDKVLQEAVLITEAFMFLYSYSLQLQPLLTVCMQKLGPWWQRRSSCTNLKILAGELWHVSFSSLWLWLSLTKTFALNPILSTIPNSNCLLQNTCVKFVRWLRFSGKFYRPLWRRTTPSPTNNTHKLSSTAPCLFE